MYANAMVAYISIYVENVLKEHYPVFESVEDNAANEKQLAPTGLTAPSPWLKILVYFSFINENVSMADLKSV